MYDSTENRHQAHTALTETLFQMQRFSQQLTLNPLNLTKPADISTPTNENTTTTTKQNSKVRSILKKPHNMNVKNKKTRTIKFVNLPSNPPCRVSRLKTPVPLAQFEPKASPSSSIQPLKVPRFTIPIVPNTELPPQNSSLHSALFLANRHSRTSPTTFPSNVHSSVSTCSMTNQNFRTLHGFVIPQLQATR